MQSYLKLVGPVWTGKLHDHEFVDNVLNHVNSKSHSDYKTKDRMVGMLNLALEELDEPLYYILDDIASIMHLQPIKHNIMRSAIINSNYKVSYSHCQKNSIKTNAPNSFIWDILKRWSEINPIKEKWLTPEHVVHRIMQNPAKATVDFTVRNDCFPVSKKDKLVRYQEPPPFWGPKAKPKRKAPDEQSTKEKINKTDE